jgi:reactive intermediate/imine deaminase
MADKTAVTTRDAPNSPAATQAVRSVGLVFVSGQTGVDPATGVLADDLAAQTRRLFANVDAVLAAAGCTSADLVAVTLKFTDLSFFREIDAIYVRWLPPRSDAPLPTTTAFAVDGLPGGALVELDAVVAIPDRAF